MKKSAKQTTRTLLSQVFLIAFFLVSITQSISHAQTISLTEHESEEIVAIKAATGVDLTPLLPLDGESFLRIQQELLFSNLFGTNTK